ncbi:MAG: Ig-like domain-containing protein [Phototrophicaceae bacterium]
MNTQLRRMICLVGMLCAVLLGCTLSNNVPPPSPTPDFPSVQFISPLNNATVIEGTELLFDMVATYQTAGIERVELVIDTQPHNQAKPTESSVPVFATQMNWLAAGVGKHIITAQAFGKDGMPGAEASIVIEVLSRSGN